MSPFVTLKLMLMFLLCQDNQFACFIHVLSNERQPRHTTGWPSTSHLHCYSMKGPTPKTQRFHWWLSPNMNSARKGHQMSSDFHFPRSTLLNILNTFLSNESLGFNWPSNIQQHFISSISFLFGWPSGVGGRGRGSVCFQGPRRWAKWRLMSADVKSLTAATFNKVRPSHHLRYNSTPWRIGVMKTDLCICVRKEILQCSSQYGRRTPQCEHRRQCQQWGETCEKSGEQEEF